MNFQSNMEMTEVEELHSTVAEATLEYSKKHQQALKIKEYGTLYHEGDLCPCCGLKIPVTSKQSGNKISLCSNIDSIAYLGVSFPMFFRLIKLITIGFCFLIPVMIACTTINFLNEIPNYMVIPSGIDSDLILTQILLHLFTLLVLMVSFRLLSKYGRDAVVDLLSKSISTTDFTIMVTGLPSTYSAIDLKRHMEFLIDGRYTPVASVIPTYDIKGLTQLGKRIHRLNEKLLLIRQEYEFRKLCCLKLEHLDQEQCQKELKKCEKKQNKIIRSFDNTNRGQVAFVCYKSFHDAKEILEYFELPFYKYCWTWLKSRKNHDSKHYFKQCFLQFSRPPHASDLNWENLLVNTWLKIKYRLLTYSISALILTIAGLFLYILREYQHTEESSTLTLLPSVLILFINLVLEFFMAIITRYELHTSYTNYKVSVARKLIVLMFLNTAVIPTVVNSYIVNEKDEWFEPGGLCSDVYTIIMINAIFPPLFYLYLFNPLYLLFLAQLRVFKNRLRKGARVSQDQANEYFTPIEIDLAERYAQVIKTVYVGLFFCPLVPLSVVFSIVGVLLEFFVTKYMLNKHPLPRVHNESLILEMFEWLRYSICVYAVGVAFFYFEIDGNTSDNYTWDSVVYTALAITILGLAYFFVPVNHLLKEKLYKKLKDEMVFQMNPEYENNQYRQFRLGPNIDIDYERANPAIKDVAIKRYEEDKKEFSEPTGTFEEFPIDWEVNINRLKSNIGMYNSLINVASLSLPIRQNYYMKQEDVTINRI